MKRTYKYTKYKNLAWNQYILFVSLRFNHSNCGFSPVIKTHANKQSLLEEKIVSYSGLDPALSSTLDHRSDALPSALLRRYEVLDLT